MKKELKKMVAAIVAALMLCATFCGCSSKDVATTQEETANPEYAATENTIDTAQETSGFDYQGKNKIALFLPLTGDLMQYGIKIRNGAEMAITQFNEANGTEFTFEVYDDKGDPNESVNVAEKIISDSNVFAAIGSFNSSCSMAAAPVFVDANMLLVSPAASHTDLPQMGPMVFPIVMSERYQGAEMASALLDVIGQDKTAAIIYQNNDNGVQASSVFRSRWEEEGNTIVYFESFVPGQTKDFSAMLSNVKELVPDVLFVQASYSDTAQVFLQAKALEVDAVYAGYGTCVCQEFVDLAGTTLDDTIVLSSTPSFMDSVLQTADLDEATLKFIEDYKNAYDATPDGFGAQGYDAMMMLLNSALNAGSTDNEAIAAQINQIRDYAGLSGFNMRFNDTKEMIKGIYVYQLVEGSFKQLRP